jgi:hypothetical protein
MEDIDHSGKANRIDSPVCVAVFIIDDLQHGSTAKTLQGLGAWMLVAVLGIVDRKTHDPANLIGKGPKVIPRRPNPCHGFLCDRHPVNIAISLY